MADSRAPPNPMSLGAFDLSRKYSSDLDERMKVLMETYLAKRVTYGLQSDFDGRFYRAAAFLLPFLDRNLPRRPRRILEIGCGKGAKSMALSLLCDEYHAIDIVPHEVNNAKKSAKVLGDKNAHFRVGEAAHIKTLLSDRDDKFDLIILYAVLEHLTPEEKLEMLAEIWNYLDEDGFPLHWRNPEPNVADGLPLVQAALLPADATRYVAALPAPGGQRRLAAPHGARDRDGRLAESRLPSRWSMSATRSSTWRSCRLRTWTITWSPTATTSAS